MQTTDIHVCAGCGSSHVGDPAEHLADLQERGRISCCPERNMIKTAAIPAKLAQFISFVRVPVTAPEALRLDHPWCWEWTGRQNRNGYGRIRWMGTEPVSHRLIWTLLRGPVDRRILLDHLCRNRLCCNPNHLDPVDNRTNTLRGEAVLFKKADEYV